MWLLTLAALASPASLAAQSSDGVPLFLAMPETYPDVDGRVVLLRERGRDIVLIRESDATAETLSIALVLLRRLNESTPRRDRQAQMVPVTGYHLTTPIGPGRRARLEEALTRLEERPLSHLGNLGFGRVLQLAPLDG
jgi:hypothetical protein